MNTSNIKKYAPKARVEFMDAVTKRLNSFGISQTKGTASKAGELRIAEAVVQGSVLQIDGNSFDSAFAEPRRRLVARSEQLGFAQLVEQEAYTWFNRLCAIRYMEIHDYLGHGFRVLSHPDNPTGFEIIDHAVDAADELDLDRDYIVELKLAGNKDEVLYRELLLKQCHKLHQAMPFLFEALNDASELLLPDNLTRTDSILRGLVDGIPEEDWQQVEVIGWLYQFYISEKKDEVIGKVVKSEDIPAATQLFTPNWIVKYLVQNSVGRQWLQTYPESPIKSQMKYYIEPAEQSAEVNEQLQAITPESIEPESIKVLDPAVGSGHILIEAYNVLKAIYEERGYRPREIPKLILENNLYGLDIDDRAAQLSGFALMMMAREDDKRIFTRNVRLNVLALQEGNHINLPAEWRALNLSGGWETGAPQDMFADETQDLSSFEADNRYQLLQRTLARFTQAKTFGSLIDVPADEYDDLKEIHETLSELAESGDSFQRPAAKQLIDIVHQALILSIRYDAVIANPPYMGSKYQTVEVRKYLKDNFRGYEKDLFSAYIIRNLQLAKENGQLGFMTPFVWMFLTSYEQLRNKLIDEETISTLIQLEYSGFDGATVPICTFTLTKGHLSGYTGSYIKLSDFRGAVNQAPKTLEAINNTNCGWFYKSKPDDFKKIPGSPIAYWASENDRDAFIDGSSLDEIAPPRLGMATGNNDIYLRLWHEVSLLKCGFELESREDALTSRKKWFPYNKGGEYRRWYGNCDYLVDWENDGQKLQTTMHASGTRLWAHNFNLEYIFKPSITWTATSSSYFAVRKSDPGFLFDVKGSSCFPHEGKENLVLGFLCSSATQHFMKILNPTIEFQPGNIASLCLPENKFDETAQNVEQVVIEAVQLAREDWNRYEISWNFLKNPLIELRAGLKLSVSSHIQDLNKKTDRLHHLEYLNNLNFVEALDLDKYLAESLDKSLITLKGNPAYRFKKIDDIKELNSAFISSLKTELISYSIGCMLGRYSLDREGLVYANSGNQDFDELVAEGAYKSFPADQNAIIPLTDQEWFKDDATDRLREFVQVVWGSEHLQENLDFIAESLCLHAIKPKKSESSLETIRRYLSTQFYKDHLKTYKKRPIYWLFSSGKHKAFECLVYLHRYNEGTLSRMRTEYVTPLLGKYDAYAEQLEKQVETAESTSDSNRFKKELATLAKQQVELREFDDKLKHYADMRISLDLDDGVKVNYGKFGDLLADVKAITGSAPEMK